MPLRFGQIVIAWLGTAGLLSAQPVYPTWSPYSSNPMTQAVAPLSHTPPPTDRADVPLTSEATAGGASGCIHAASGCAVFTPCESAGCVPCGPPGRLWVNADFLFWAVQGSSIPPLVTTSPAGTPRTQAGVLGGPGTTVVFGDQRINNDFRPGFEVQGGLWLDECNRFGIAGDFFFLGDSRQGFAAASLGTPILARPFFNVATNASDAQLIAAGGTGNGSDSQLIAFPGLVAGTVVVNSSSSFLGAGVNGLYNLCCDCRGRLDLIAGYRYLRLTDELSIAEDLTTTGAVTGVPIGTRFQVLDRFRTENDFHGGRVGAAAEMSRGRFFADVSGSVAFGVTHSVVEISGSTVITLPGAAPVTQPRGLLAQTTNIGRYTSDEFAVVPEVSFRVGMRVTDHLRAYAGYTFLYWSNVARPGNQIDLGLNPTQIPTGGLVGAPRPVFLRHDSDLWVQGLNLGLEFRF